MVHYQLSRLFYDLHTDRALAGEYRLNRSAIIARYALGDEIAGALCRDDVSFLARLTNGFLLRYYFIAAEMSETDFIAGLQPQCEAHDG